MAKKKKRGSTVQFYGTSELLKKIEAAGGDVEGAITRAVQKSMQQPKAEMQAFFIQQHHLTGATERSFEESPIVWSSGQLKYYAGFNMKKGGIAALFFEIGTPKMPPRFFIYNIVKKNLTSIRDEQQKALNEAFRELM